LTLSQLSRAHAHAFALSLSSIAVVCFVVWLLYKPCCRCALGLVRRVAMAILHTLRVALAIVCCWDTSAKAAKDIRSHDKNARRLSAASRKGR
jgi:hypothetical protein